MTERIDPQYPFLKPVEQGRFIAPDYDTELDSFEIHPADWQHRASAHFGPSRPCGSGESTRWNGDSYRYDIFRNEDWKQLALLWSNGSGEGWLICHNRIRREETPLLLLIADEPSEPRRWDFCHFLWQAAEKSACAGVKTGRMTYAQAFLDGRLKKRRRHGQIFVHSQPKIIPLAS